MNPFTIFTLSEKGLQNTNYGGKKQYTTKWDSSVYEKQKERIYSMFDVKKGIISKAIAVRRRREEKIFKTGILAGSLAMMIVCRILFRIKCRRCKKKNKK